LFSDPDFVAAMAAFSGPPERSFKRRFAKVTGVSPMGTRRGPRDREVAVAGSLLEYIHTLRLDEAKRMLETTEQPIEAVANEVGYEDASFFGASSAARRPRARPVP
jgi:AraC-like DNA-binding protein